MDNKSLVFKLENIDRYFNGKDLTKNQSAETYPVLSEDQWSVFLNTYMNNDQEMMAQLIGKIEQLNWCEEEKLLWNIFLAVRCEGSERYLRELEWLLKKFRHENPIIEELLTGAGDILLNRENRMREDVYQREMKVLNDIADEKERETELAKKNLRRHELIGNI